jgi:hypothetical protein
MSRLDRPPPTLDAQTTITGVESMFKVTRGPRRHSLLRPATVLVVALLAGVGVVAATATPARANTTSAATASPSGGSNPPPGSIITPTVKVSWQYTGNGTGSVTVQGWGFTPEGTVQITYYLDVISYFGEADPGAASFMDVTASQPVVFCRWTCVTIPGGSFTVSQPDTPCGTYFGPLGKGWIVDAFDLKSGADPRQGVATPCQ